MRLVIAVDSKISMRTEFHSGGGGETKEFSFAKFPEGVLKEIEENIEITMEYAHIQLQKRCEKLEEQLTALLYAPGGPKYYEVKADFEARANN